MATTTVPTMVRKTSKKPLTTAQVGLREGFRSGLEEAVAQQLRANSVEYRYEEEVVRYTTPPKDHKYTPDFVLANGIIIETKGRFVTADRQKHLLVKAQNPELDIRFVFSNSKSKISKRSPTTYAMWCEKNGFKYSDKWIPDAWLKEKAHGIQRKD